MKLAKRVNPSQINLRYKGAFLSIKGPLVCILAVLAVGIIALGLIKELLSIES